MHDRRVDSTSNQPRGVLQPDKLTLHQKTSLPPISFPLKPFPILPEKLRANQALEGDGQKEQGTKSGNFGRPEKEIQEHACVLKMRYLRRKTDVMKRDKAIETVKELPKEFELDVLLERLVFIEKVQQGLAQVKQKKLVPHSSVKEIVKKW